MYKDLFCQLKKKVVQQLQSLDPHLSYHNTNHTLDVVDAAERIARQENITDKKTVFLLKIAALYHDTGFLKTYKGHEEMSCALFLADNKEGVFTDEDKRLVLELIMATRTPQQPQTHLQCIICDADLDYLGRDDFPEISAKLRTEFLNYGFISREEEWDEVQLRFIENHHYHTLSSRSLREPVKQRHYLALSLH